MVHVGIWAPEPDSVLPFAHAVNTERNQCIMKTGLPSSDKYVVVGCNDPELASLAAAQANSWARFQTPFDEIRLQISERRYSTLTKSARQAKGSKEEKLEKVREMMDKYQRAEYVRSGRFRSVKYASRRMSPMSSPKPGRKKWGAWCGMYVLMCYPTHRKTPSF